MKYWIIFLAAQLVWHQKTSEGQFKRRAILALREREPLFAPDAISGGIWYYVSVRRHCQRKRG